MRKEILIGAALALLALPAHADLYVGFGTGDASLREDVAATTDDFDAATTGNSYFFGLDLGRRVAFEVTRFDFGPFEDGIGPGGPTLRAVALDGDALSFVLKERIAGDLKVFVRAGWFSWDSREGTVARSGTDPLFGVGLAFRLADHLELRGEYLRADAGAQRLEVPTLSIAYRF